MVVAHHQRQAGIAAGFGQGRQQVARVGLADGVAVTAADGGEEARQPQFRQQHPRRHDRLVGADRHAPALFRQHAQRRLHTVIGACLAGGVGGVIVQEISQCRVVRGFAARRKAAFHQQPGAIAHHGSHLGTGECRQPAACHQPVEGGREIRHGIHQRAIEIEYQGALHTSTVQRYMLKINVIRVSLT